jgi:plasmid stability protein
MRRKEVLLMPSLTVRQLEDDIYRGLKALAESHGRSMESEVRDILAEAVRGRRWWPQWVKATEDLRGDEVLLPVR